MATSDQDHKASVVLMESQGLGASVVSQADGTHTLQLSLFLMLLTFFFVLTSATSFDDRRVGTVIGGIQDTFGALNSAALDETGRHSGGTLPVLQPGSRAASGDFSDAIVAAFAEVEGEESLRRHGSLELALDVSSLFVEGAAAVRADKQALFAALGAALADGRDDRHVAILVPAASQNRLDVRRAASVARLLSAAGAPQGHLAVGVSDAPIAHVSFRFFTLPGASS